MSGNFAAPAPPACSAIDLQTTIRMLMLIFYDDVHGRRSSFVRSEANRGRQRGREGSWEKSASPLPKGSGTFFLGGSGPSVSFLTTIAVVY